MHCILILRVLRRIFGPKRDEVTGGWRKLHNEELHNLYSSPSIIRMIKSVCPGIIWTGCGVDHSSHSAESKNALSFTAPCILIA
jgi:hypothetical protein